MANAEGPEGVVVTSPSCVPCRAEQTKKDIIPANRNKRPAEAKRKGIIIGSMGRPKRSLQMGHGRLDVAAPIWVGLLSPPRHAMPSDENGFVACVLRSLNLNVAIRKSA